MRNKELIVALWAVFTLVAVLTVITAIVRVNYADRELIECNKQLLYGE